MEVRLNIPENITDRILKLWRMDDIEIFTKYVHSILEVYVKSVEDMAESVTITSPFILVTDPTLNEDEMLILSRETDERYVVKITDVEAYLEENERYGTPLECIQLQDVDDENIKFTIRINHLTSEHDIVGGWNEPIEEEE